MHCVHGPSKALLHRIVELAHQCITGLSALHSIGCNQAGHVLISITTVQRQYKAGMPGLGECEHVRVSSSQGWGVKCPS